MYTSSMKLGSCPGREGRNQYLQDWPGEMLHTHLDGVEFLLQYILNLLVQCRIVQPAVEAATHDDIGPDYTA